jgi:hypothetical protein
MKIFGREPALVVGFVGAVLTLAAGLNFPWLSAGMAAAITSAVTAGVIAWATRPIAPALYVGALAAVVAVLAEYGFDVPDRVTSALPAVILAAFSLFGIRPQVSPVK